MLHSVNTMKGWTLSVALKTATAVVYGMLVFGCSSCSPLDQIVGSDWDLRDGSGDISEDGEGWEVESGTMEVDVSTDGVGAAEDVGIDEQQDEHVVSDALDAETDPSSGSCETSCGDQSPSGCWCDNACVDRADCCADKAEWCDPIHVDPCELAGGTCFVNPSDAGLVDGCHKLGMDYVNAPCEDSDKTCCLE